MRQSDNPKNSSLPAQPEVRFHFRLAISSTQALLPWACNLDLLRVKAGIMDDRNRALD
jgi:hypothetical protein